MKEGIDVTGIPGPNPMLGCGIILFVVGVVAVIAISGYLLFNASLILQMLFYSIWAIVVGIILIVYCIIFKNRIVWMNSKKKNIQKTSGTRKNVIKVAYSGKYKPGQKVII